MSSSPLSRILLVGDPPTSEIQAALETTGFGVACYGFSGIDPAEIAHCQALLLCVTGKVRNSAQALCRRWRIELGEQYIPIVWLATEDVPPAAGLDAGADVVLATTAPTEQITAQLKALLRIQHLHGRLAGRAAEAQNLNQRLQQAHQQIDSDLDLTRRIHRGFLPRTLPDVGNAKFAVCYRPRSRIGGDFYDVIRLDEDYVGLYVADAMGRGLPASSLLSIFVKKSVIGKEITGATYRLVPPNEVLDRLNRELVNLSLHEPPFVTMSYVQFNCRDGTLSFSRAAHPHPLLIPSESEPEYWHSAGTLLGVFEAEFPMQKKQLQPGDKLLLYTDGVHPPTTGPGANNDPLPAVVKRHRHLSAQPFVDSVARDLLEESRYPEDFTLLVLEYRP